MQRPRPKGYWNAVQALYGKKSDLDALGLDKPKKTPPKPRLYPTEAQEQFAAVAKLRKLGVIFYHIPNGGWRNPIEAAKFKRLGVSAGIPDICIPMARKGYHGLYIELKRVKGGVTSEAQMLWLDELRRQGYDTFIAKGCDELITYVRNYLGV